MTAARIGSCSSSSSCSRALETFFEASPIPPPAFRFLPAADFACPFARSSAPHPGPGAPLPGRARPGLGRHRVVRVRNRLLELALGLIGRLAHGVELHPVLLVRHVVAHLLERVGLPSFLLLELVQRLPHARELPQPLELQDQVQIGREQQAPQLFELTMMTR